MMSQRRREEVGLQPIKSAETTRVYKITCCDGFGVNMKVGAAPGLKELLHKQMYSSCELNANLNEI